jgi:acyl-CoA synthetase (NDP forming)/GNAT superfamily N-acetyltransferase
LRVGTKVAGLAADGPCRLLRPLPHSERMPSAHLDAMERDVLTSDGLTAHIRHARPDDAEAIAALHSKGLSDVSASFRFLSARPQLEGDLVDSWASADGVRDATLLAFRGDRLAAVALYRHVDDATADVAFAVTDDLQHRGLGTLLLEDLAVIARRAGYRRFVAQTAFDNSAMRAVFRDAGLEMRSTFGEGLTEVDLGLLDDRELARRADERDRLATAASLRPLLSPSHVVVIGASAGGEKVGNVVLGNLLRSFSGQVSVVHPTAAAIDGVRAFRTVRDLPTTPDQAIIAVPAAAVPDVIDDCGAAGVRGAVILSAGFAEVGRDGRALEAEVLERVRRHGMRVIGPNCFGVVNASLGYNATFGSAPIVAGSVAFASQSGGLGIALLNAIAQLGLGISSFVSLGNKVDVSSNDLLCAWEADPSVRVIALYLESFGNARKFARLARSVSRTTPIVALKGGRSEAGQRGASSHTAALATDDAVVDALFGHGGVIRAYTLEELLDVVSILDRHSLPTGRRLAIVGNAGGPLVLAADAAEASQLTVPQISETLQAQILRVAPNAAAVGNPVDLLATVSELQMSAVLDLIAQSGEFDAIVAIRVPLNAPAPAGSGASPRPVPVIDVHMGVPTAALPPGGFPSPERAMHALSAVARYAQWRREPVQDAQPDVVGRQTAERVRGVASRLNSMLCDADGWLAPADAVQVVRELGIAVPNSSAAGSADELTRAAAQLRPPLALKAQVRGLVHKSEAGALALDLRTVDETVAAYRRFETAFADDLLGALVQEYRPDGVELIIGVTRSDRYGPLLLVGAGGVAAEVIDDRVVLLAPVTAAEAAGALQRLRIARQFPSWRHRPAVDVDSIIHALVQVGELACAAPTIAEMDVNPLIVSGGGALAVDVRIRVGGATGSPTPLRGLRPAAVR